MARIDMAFLGGANSPRPSLVLADVEAMLKTQGAALDRAWVDAALVDLYGQRDPRISEWRELVAEMP